MQDAKGPFQQIIQFAGSSPQTVNPKQRQLWENQLKELQNKQKQVRAQLQPIQNAEEKAGSAVYRQSILAKKTYLEEQLKGLNRQMHGLRSQLRWLHLTEQLQQLKQIQGNLTSTLFVNLHIGAKVEQLALPMETLGQALAELYLAAHLLPPQPIQVLFLDCLDLAQKMLLTLQQNQPTQFQTLKTQSQSIQNTLKTKAAAFSQETRIFEQLNRLWQTLILQGFVWLKKPIDPSPAVQKASVVPEKLQGFGELEVKFDFNQGKVQVKDQLGIDITQKKGDYLTEVARGMKWLKQSACIEYADKSQLERAVDHFLTAMGLDKTRYEAYFGLGYLFSSIGHYPKALEFLKIAVKIHPDSKIQNMIRLVQRESFRTR